MAPDQCFEAKILKDDAVRAKWLALSAHERRAISFRFFQIAISPELRLRLKRLPDQVRPNGRTLFRFIMDMGFGEFPFAMPPGCSTGIALIDFYVGTELLRAELKSRGWHH